MVYCIFSKRNEMFLKISTRRIFAFFLTKFAIFVSFLTFIVIVQIFLASGVREPPLGFDNKLLAIFAWSWNNFQLFKITNFNFFLKNLVFSSL